MDSIFEAGISNCGTRDHSVIATNKQVVLYGQGNVHGKNIFYSRWNGMLGVLQGN